MGSGGGSRVVLLPSARSAEAATPEAGRLEARFLVTSLALIGAVGAGLAGGHPTGIAPWDVFCRVALGAVTVLAGAVCPWPFIALAAVPLLVATLHSGAIVIPVAILLTATAGMWARWRDSGRSPLLILQSRLGSTALKTLAGLLLCQLALRLSWPSQPLWPSFVAAVALLLLLVPGLICCPRPYRRFVAGGSLLAFIAALALTAVAGFAGLSAKNLLQDAVNSSQAGLAAVQAGDQPAALSDFTAAARDFRSANSRLGAAHFAEIVPVVGQQVRAAEAAARIGEGVAEMARRTALRANLNALHVTHGAFPIGVIESLVPLLREDYSALNRGLAETGPFRSHWLLSALKSRLTSEVAKLRSARHAAHSAYEAASVAPGLLGAGGPVRYLVLFENPAESRASGGIVGNFAQLTAEHGHLHLDRVGSVGQLNSGGDPAKRVLRGPSDYLDRYSQFEPQDYWQNVPMSPDFPSVGEVAADLYPQSGGVPVQGVISLDPQALAGFLSVTGPLSVPLWPTPISATNAVSILAHTEFIYFSARPAEQSLFEQQVVRALWARLVSEPLPALPALINDLRPTVKGHNLLLYDKNKRIEDYFRSVHLAGAMPAVRGDFLGVVTQNAAGNKIDWYLRRSIDYRATVNFSTGAVTATVKVTLRNLAPSSGLPADVIDPSPGATTSPGESELYLSIYTPWEDNGATLGNKALALSSQQELGRFVYSALLKVPPRTAVTLVLHLVGSWSRALHRYHLELFHQVVLFPDHVHTAVTALGSWRRRSGTRIG